MTWIKRDIHLVKKPYGLFHPKYLENYTPQEKFWPSEFGNLKRYGYLDDSSPYCEYAWELLRRNRFFQKQHDQQTHQDIDFDLDQNKWACWEKFDGTFNCGLTDDVHYRELYSKNVRWTQYEDVLENCINLRHASPDVLHPRKRATGYTVLFDLNPDPNGEPSLEMQMEVVRRFLIQLATQRKFLTPRSRQKKRASKEKLRHLLRIVDLFSSPEANLRSVSQVFINSNVYPVLGRAKKKQADVRSASTIDGRKILIPNEISGSIKKSFRTEEEMKADANSIKLDEIEDPMRRLTSEAFDLVYLGGYLDLIQFDFQTPSTKKIRAQETHFSQFIDETLTPKKSKSITQKSAVEEKQQDTVVSK